MSTRPLGDVAAVLPPDLVLVVPCYNEEERLDTAAFLEFAAKSPCTRVLFVDDGSTDRTRAVLDSLVIRAAHSFSVLPLAANAGKGEAVRLGLLAALDREPEIVGYWDADLSTPLSALDDFRRVFLDHDEIVAAIGSRVRLLGRVIQRQPARHYFGRVFATCASMVLRLPVYDTQCGAKLFRVNESLKVCLGTPFSSRWIFDVELLARLMNGLVTKRLTPNRGIYEVTLREWREVPGSKLRLRDGFQAFTELLRIRRQLRRAGNAFSVAAQISGSAHHTPGGEASTRATALRASAETHGEHHAKS